MGHEHAHLLLEHVVLELEEGFPTGELVMVLLQGGRPLSSHLRVCIGKGLLARRYEGGLIGENAPFQGLEALVLHLLVAGGPGGLPLAEGHDRLPLDDGGLPEGQVRPAPRAPKGERNNVGRALPGLRSCPRRDRGPPCPARPSAKEEASPTGGARGGAPDGASLCLLGAGASSLAAQCVGTGGGLGGRSSLPPGDGGGTEGPAHASALVVSLLVAMKLREEGCVCARMTKKRGKKAEIGRAHV